MSQKKIEPKYPVHWLVWNHDYRQLDKLLSSTEHNLEILDPKGRTPLHLSVTLGDLECTRVLLRHGANACTENSRNWTVVQEAVSVGDPEQLSLCLQYRDYQMFCNRTTDVRSLLQRLNQAMDFYVEMKWEFTSWLPLVSALCPSDTYKVWKSGSSVRVDTTLLGYDRERSRWQRGSRSYVFKHQANSSTMMEIDHDACKVYTNVVQNTRPPPDVTYLAPSEEAVAQRLTTPLMTTFIDTEKISFERSKSGVWGWRSDKTEMVNGRQCKVFSAGNVHLVTKTRTEHLTEEDKKKVKSSGSRHPLESLESFLGTVEEQKLAANPSASMTNGDVTSNVLASVYNPCAVTPEEYFDDDDRRHSEDDLLGLAAGARSSSTRVGSATPDIGRPIEQTTRTQKFKAKLWLCEDYPLSLQEQVLPIIDLMAANNAHFKKLRDFITLQLPAGFPVKIEIPLFHVLNARITFGNIFAMETPSDYVQCIREDNGAVSCVVSESCFEAPPTYSTVGGDISQERYREDDEYLQLAMQQSLLEAGETGEQVTLWEALDKNKSSSGLNHGGGGGGRVPGILNEDRMLQKALEESILLAQCRGISLSSSSGASVLDDDNDDTSTTTASPSSQVCPPDDEQSIMAAALELSKREQEEQMRRQREEEEELERILQLSLTEK